MTIEYFTLTDFNDVCVGSRTKIFSVACKEVGSEKVAEVFVDWGRFLPLNVRPFHDFYFSL